MQEKRGRPKKNPVTDENQDPKKKKLKKKDTDEYSPEDSLVRRKRRKPKMSRPKQSEKYENGVLKEQKKRGRPPKKVTQNATPNSVKTAPTDSDIKVKTSCVTKIEVTKTENTKVVKKREDKSERKALQDISNTSKEKVSSESESESESLSESNHQPVKKRVKAC